MSEEHKPGNGMIGLVHNIARIIATVNIARIKVILTIPQVLGCICPILPLVILRGEARGKGQIEVDAVWC
jgi:hypothetical protein